MLTIHVVSHTHWDREWYLPFQQFRFRLVELIDQLLALLDADPNYHHFMLDGQVIVLEDYLEIRPEREEDIRRYVQEGRLVIGPWYILPDEFLVSPEATVRNLLIGERVCRRFGPRMKIGYLPDPFGHIGQMPQILRGFGINVACLWRGAGDQPTELYWRAPDGSKVLLLHLRDSYGNAARLPADEDGFVQGLMGLRDSLAPYATTSHILAMQGTDHMRPRADLSRLLAAAGARLENTRVVHSTLPRYLAAVRDELDERESRLPVIGGELRSPQRAHLLPGVLSTRMWIKQRNHACETLLEKWVEPFGAIAGQVEEDMRKRVNEEMRKRVDEEMRKQVGGASSTHLPVYSSTRQLTHRAWKYLLENHPHDSICGCSVDQVHREMVTRFDWCVQIGEEVTRRALQAIVRQINTSTPAIVVFNPASGPRTDLVSVGVEPPLESGMVLLDKAGQPVPYRTLYRHSRILSRLTIQFVARDLPPLGYHTYHFQASSHQPSAISIQHPVSNIQYPAASIKNEFFRVEVNSDDGTLTISDETTGLVLRGCNRFVDGGDRGDEYNYCQPEHDRLVDHPATPPTIRLLAADEIGATLEITLLYQVPVSLASEDRSRRDDETVPLPIVTRVTLTPGVRRVDFETTVENQIGDHRFRVHFPTGLTVDTAFADGHCDVVERPLDALDGTDTWAEQPVSTHPQRAFVDVSDGEQGVMLANRGLPEYEVLRCEDGAEIALTLLRCIGWLSRDDMHCRRGHAGPAEAVPEAQCPGRHTFRYSLIPHTGDYRQAHALAYSFQTDLRAILAGAHPGPLVLSEVEGPVLSEVEGLSTTLSFVTVEPATLEISAVKAPEEGEGLIVRCWNVGSEPVKGTIRLWRPFRRALRVNLAEEGATELAHHANAVTLPVRGREIVTLRFEF